MGDVPSPLSAEEEAELPPEIRQFFPKFNVPYLLRGIVYWCCLNCVRDQTARFARVNGRGMHDDRSTRIIGGDCHLCRARRMVGSVGIPHGVAGVQTGSPAHAFPRAIFVTLLPFSSFRSAFRLAGAGLEIASTSVRRAP